MEEECLAIFPFVSLPCKEHRTSWVWIYSFLPILPSSYQSLLNPVLVIFYTTDRLLDICPLPEQPNGTFFEEEKWCSHKHQGKPSPFWKPAGLQDLPLLIVLLPKAHRPPITYVQTIFLAIHSVTSPEEPSLVTTLVLSLSLQRIVHPQNAKLCTCHCCRDAFSPDLKIPIHCWGGWWNAAIQFCLDLQINLIAPFQCSNSSYI